MARRRHPGTEVHQVIAESDLPFDPDVYLAAVKGYYTTPGGEMLSLPLNSSTPVLCGDWCLTVYRRTETAPRVAPELIERFATV